MIIAHLSENVGLCFTSKYYYYDELETFAKWVLNLRRLKM